MSGATVPLAWTKLVAGHHFVRIDRELMRTADTQQARDEAATRYARGVDELMDQMAKLEDDRQLGRITLFLSKRERV